MPVQDNEDSRKKEPAPVLEDEQRKQQVQNATRQFTFRLKITVFRGFPPVPGSPAAPEDSGS